MKNAKNTAKKSDAKIADDKILTVADVARELGHDPKRARAFLRKNDSLYSMRKQKFTASSALYKKCVDALTAYKNKNRVITA